MNEVRPFGQIPFFMRSSFLVLSLISRFVTHFSFCHSFLVLSLISLITVYILLEGSLLKIV